MPKVAKITNICVYCKRNKYARKFVFMQIRTKDKEREGEEGEVTNVK